jgi:hypothetical protein
MSSIQINNISFFYGSDLKLTPSGSLTISRQSGLITSIKPISSSVSQQQQVKNQLPDQGPSDDNDLLVVDASGYLLLPGFVDAGIIAGGIDSLNGGLNGIAGALVEVGCYSVF